MCNARRSDVKRCALIIEGDVATMGANDKASGALDDPNEGEDGEGEGCPVNKA